MSQTNLPDQGRSAAVRRYAEQELNGLEQGEDAMTDEKGEGVEGEGEPKTADWRVRAGPKKQADCKRKGRSRSNTHAIRRAHTA